MSYCNKNVFLFLALMLSFGLALLLSLPHRNPTTQIDEIGIDILMVWGIPTITTFIVQAGHQLTDRKQPDVLYINLFSFFWLISAFTQIVDKLY